ITKDLCLNTVKIMSSEDLNRTYRRFAHQCLEPHDRPDQLALIGLQPRGVSMGKRILQLSDEVFDLQPDFGVVDVTYYRDNFRTRLKMPQVKVTVFPFDLDDKDVVLIDDVLYT